MLLAADRDYAAAAEALTAEWASDRDYVRRMAELVTSVRAALAASAPGTPVALERQGSREKVEGTVLRAGPHRLEILSGGRGATVELGDLSAASLAALFWAKLSKKTEGEALAAAALCLVEGDADTARRYPSPPLPERYALLAERVAKAREADEGREAEARRRVAGLDELLRDPAGAFEASLLAKAIVSELGDTRLVKRNRASLLERAEPRKDFFWGPGDLVATGAFQAGRLGEVDDVWIVARDPAAGDQLEASFAAAAATEYRGWVYAGACCRETLAFTAEGADGAALKPKLDSIPLPRTHAGHGAKPALRWSWVELPIGRFAKEGVKPLRLRPARKGAGFGALVVSAVRTAPPKDVEEARRFRKAFPAVVRVAPADLVGYWNFDETAGALAADAKGRHGSLRGDARFGSGRAKGGLVLGGVNGYVEVGDAPDLNPGEITMAAWVFLPAKPTRAGNIVSKGQNAGYRFRVGNDLQVEVFDRGTENGLRTDPGRVPLNQWVHVAVTGDRGGLKIYLNGTLAVSNTVPYGAPRPPHSLKIGSETDFGEYFQGTLDDVCLYRRALTPAEIRSLVRFGPG
jgi:hypothetical protein